MHNSSFLKISSLPFSESAVLEVNYGHDPSFDINAKIRYKLVKTPT